MKTQLLKGLCFTTMMLALVTGCGKDNKSSEGSGVASNPYTGTIPVNSQQAFNNLKSWYENPNTQGLPNNPGAYTETRTIQTSNNDSNCKTKSYLGGFFNIDYCFSSTTTGLPTVQRTVFVVAGQAKSANTKLAQVFAPPGGYIMLGTSQQMSLYTVEFGNPQTDHVLRYKVDTSVHSAFNPVEIYDSTTGTKEWVSGIR